MTGKWLELHTLSVISDMAIGGIGAYLCIHNDRFLSAMRNSHPLVNLIPYCMTLFFISYKYEIFVQPFLIVTERIIVAFFFIWIILEQNFCTRSYFKISNLRLISKLGKYTYGLYCLHTIAILISVTLLRKYGLSEHGWQLILFEMPLSMAISIVMSYVSYTYFESVFLRLKDRFAYIVSK